MKTLTKLYEAKKVDPVLAAKIAKGTELGTKAFKDGKKGVPAHDKDLMKYLESIDTGVFGSSVPIMKAWSAAWDKANLAAPY